MIINVKVYPRSHKQMIVKEKEEYKVYLHCAPVKGEANNELVKLLAEHFDIPRTSILILSGYKSRSKIIKIGKL